MLPTRAALLCLWVAASAPSILADSRETLTLTFASRGVVVDGVTPGGTLVVFARAVRRVGRVFTVTVSLELLVKDESGIGRVPINTDRELPPDAVWTVVDLTTGRNAVVARGAAGGPTGMGDGELQYDVAQGQFRVQRRVANVLVVRAGEDAWTATVGDGASTDDDRKLNGRATLRHGNLKNLNRTSNRPFTRLRKGDLVFVLDPATLSVWANAELGE
jgi:hypothetical protein